jgi:uncharacterized protein with FMN-binding domain
MFKYRFLSLIGFATGTALVLVASPPTLFDNHASLDELVNTDPVTEASPSPMPTMSVSETPSPTSSATTTTKPTATPTATKTTLKPSPTASVTKSTAPVTSTKTLTGDTYAASKYGSVQVQIVVTDGVVTSAKALIFPNADSRSSAISASAIPVLIQQTLSAKNSSDIQGATGASYTSAAWIDSLQSALAKL